MTDVPRAFSQGGVTGRIWGRHPELGADRVYVLFTSTEETLAAVRAARRLARALHTGVTVIHFRPVSFGVPLEEPVGLSPVEAEEFRRRLEEEDSDAEVRVYLCRDPRGAVASMLTGASLVVVGHHRRWWRTPADRWRRTLEEAGHFVVLVEERAHT